MSDPDGSPSADFALGVASNGQYCKKYLLRRHHFGAVSAGWRAALERFHHDWPFILAGKAPPPLPGNGADPVSLDYAANKFVERELARSSSGASSPPGRSSRFATHWTCSWRTSASAATCGRSFQMTSPTCGSRWAASGGGTRRAVACRWTASVRSGRTC